MAVSLLENGKAGIRWLESKRDIKLSQLVETQFKYVY